MNTDNPPEVEIDEDYEAEIDYGDPDHDWENYDPPDDGPDTYSWRE